jgi:DNA integrity scanning protein DisA with diadenylate cyclase activity
MYTIRLFMWGYQAHFRISAQVATEGIFNQLDNKLIPRVFLVGILVEDQDDRYPICIEPEDCGYEPDSFSDVKEQAQHLEAIDEERLIIHSHPIAQENHNQRLKLRALKNAIQATINRYDEYRGVISFCSWPVLVQGYRVCVVVQFNRDAFQSHYSLIKDRVDGRYAIATSLIDATVTECLNACVEALHKPDPGSGFGIVERDYDEIIRAAGKYLMYTPASAGAEIDGLHGLFEACNTISSLRYEGAETIGRMLVARRGHPNIETTLALVRPVRMGDYRAVRKLLEMSSDELCLLSDSGYIYGLGKAVSLYDQRAEDLFSIRFTKHYTWELYHADHLMMRVVYGQPELPKPRIDRRKFESDIQRIFSQVTPKETAHLWELVIEATRQKHGTMVVVSAGAHEEAKRLENQATVIEPVVLTLQMMKMVTAIDGAVLIDPSSTCYAIGVILDGLASKKGTPSRGARYNSAIRYVESSNYPCLAIVVSEDGSIDLLPNLMPQIRRSAITEAIMQLRKIKDEKNFDAKMFSKTMDWLSSHKFYLLPEVCNEINSLRREVEVVRDHLLEPTSVRIVYSDFIPNEEMDESYLLDESR